MIQYTLILLKDSSDILVSDEEIKGWCYQHHTSKFYYQQYGNNSMYDIPNGKLQFVLSRIIGFSKVIAGIDSLPTLTYSEEVKQQLKDKYGWVDVEELAEKEADMFEWDFENPDGNGWQNYVDGFRKGFKAHQSLTNKMFSLEDIVQLIGTKLYSKIINGVYDDQGERQDEKLKHDIKFDLQSLQQTIQLKVEIERKNNFINIIKIL